MSYTMSQITAWKASNEQLRPGKALLLYQKYLKPGAFLDIQIEDESRIELEQLLLDEMKLLDASLPLTFFSKVEDYIRQNLSSAAKDFTKTKEYKKCLATLLQASNVSQSLKQAGIF